MRIRRNRQDHSFEAINVTPLIDVVMCLIIFFLLVGKLATDRSRQVKLPETKVGETARAADPLIVDIIRAEPGVSGAPAQGAPWLGGIAIASVAGGEARDAAMLEAVIRERLLGRPATAVQVRADRTLPYGAVEPVLRACGKAGAKSVRLATEKRP